MALNAYLHYIHRIINRKAVDDLQQDLHDVFSSIEIIIVEHNTIIPRMLSPCSLPAH